MNFSILIMCIIFNRKKSTNIKLVMTKEDLLNALNQLDIIKKVINRPVQVNGTHCWCDFKCLL